MDVYENLSRLQISLPPVPPTAGVFVPARAFGKKLLYLSGVGPELRDGHFAYIGRVGQDVDEETAVLAARSAGITMLTQLYAYLGDLNKIRQIVKVLGFVNCIPDFTRQPAVINGFSQLMIDVFGVEIGAHARSAIGVCSLPGGIPVEVEMLVELI